MAKIPQMMVELFKPRSWNSRVAPVVGKLAPSDVIDCLKKVPGDDMYADTMKYLESAYNASGLFYQKSISETLAEAVLRESAFLRGFHGCRALSVSSYNRDGLVTLTRQRLAQYAHAIFDGSIEPENGSDESVSVAGLRICVSSVAAVPR